MRGYINHELEINRIKEAAAKYKIDVNSGLLDSTERVAFLGIEGLTMRKLAEEKVIDMFTRIVNYAKPEWAKFRDCLSNATPPCGVAYTDDFLAGSPIIVPHPKMPDKVIVFTNLVMDIYEDAKNPFYWARQRLLKQGETFLKTYFADLKDPKRAQAWATTHRAKKRLLRYEVMDVSRALTRCLPKLTAACTSSQIRDIATTIVEYNSPVELRYADTDPSDFWRMYNNGPDSCMKDNGSRQFSWMGKMKKPIHPTSIFAYSPYVRGVYMVKGETVVARTFIYDATFFGKAKTPTWVRGRVYGATQKYSGIFTAALDKEGIRNFDGVVDLNKSYTIQVPAINVDVEEAVKVGVPAGKYMYVPYLDNHCPNARVDYDDETDMLTVTFNPQDGKAVNCAMTNQHGYISASAFMSNTCHACGGDITPGNRSIFANDGAVFHDNTCALSAGYVAAIIGANNAVAWVRRDSPTLIFDSINSKYYTPSGATAYRVLPLIASIKEDPDGEPIMTTAGDVVEIYGERYRMLGNTLNSIPSKYIKSKMDHKQGTSYYLIEPDAFRNKYIDVKSVRTVILPEDHVPVDVKVLRELERLAV